MSGEDSQEINVGKSEANKPLNRFRNITACELRQRSNSRFGIVVIIIMYIMHTNSLDDDHLISLVPIPNIPECQNDYINASYIDVRETN